MVNYASTWENPSVKYGLLGGLITILTLICYYLMGIEAFTNARYGLVVFGILFVVNISLGTWSGLEERQNNGGLLSFKDGVIRVLLTFLIIVVCYHGFYYLLFNFFDPSLQEASKDIMIEQMRKQAANQDSLGQVQTETRIENIRNSRLTIFNTLFLTFIWSLLSLLVALIIAAFLRNEPETS